MENPILDFLYDYGFQNKAKIYQKLIKQDIDIKFSEFIFILKTHPNIHLPSIYFNLKNILPDINFRIVLDALLMFPAQNFDSLCKSQLESKKWLIYNLTNLQLNYNSGIIVGGWHGVLALMLQNKFILTTDIDPDAIKIAKMFGCITEVANAFDIDYKPYEIILNTACEHWSFDLWIKLIPEGKLVVLQSTDMKWETHIDNVYSMAEFINRSQLSEVYTADEKSFYGAGQNYNRFLLIGRK